MVRSASRTSAPASNVLRQEIDLSSSIPPPNAPQEETLSFWEELCTVPENQWASEHEKGFKVYLYDHEVARSPYLAVITHSFDVEWIKQNYGGGLYRAQLNDPAGRIVSKEIFAIDGDSKRKPPQNAQAAGAPQQQQQPDSFQAQMLEIMREGQRRQEDLIRQLMDRNTTPPAAPSVIDPNVALKGVVEIFSSLVARAATPQPQMDFVQMFALVDKMRGPDLLTVLTQAKTAGLIPATGGGGDLMSQLSGVIEVAEKIGLTSGKGGKSLGEAVIEKLPDILEAGGKAMEKYQTIESTRLATAREVRAIQQQQRGTVITPPPQPPAGQVTQHAGSQPPQTHAQEAPFPAAYSSGLDVEAPGSPAAADAIAEAERQDAFIKGKIVEAIAAGDSGAEIIDFLDKIDKTICDRFDGASVEQIVYFFSTDPVLKKAASLPRFKPAIAEIVEELNAPDEVLEATTKPN